MIKGGDLFGDGVNIAARLQTLASAGGVCLSGVANDQVRKILPFAFADLGAQQVKNIDEPVRAFSVVAERAAVVTASENASVPLALPDKPSIAVLPFQNMSGDPEQEYFADGMVEEIITALSRFKWLRLAVAVVEERDGHIERSGDRLKTSCADTVDALLVLLNLLEADAEFVSELCLRDFLFHTPQANALAQFNVGFAGTALLHLLCC